MNTKKKSEDNIDKLLSTGNADYQNINTKKHHTTALLYAKRIVNRPISKA
jgi:hypothetical protein